MFFVFINILQHFKFKNWRIGEFVFWCHEQVMYFLNSNRKAVKATVILLPLFGLHWLLTLYRPSSGNCILLSIYKYLNITLDGLQGLMVAIAFCYRNAEVSHPKNIFREDIFENLEYNVSFIPYFCLLVFGILVTLVAWFSFLFFHLAYLVLQNVNKDYIIFLYFRNFIVKGDQKPKTKNGMKET